VKRRVNVPRAPHPKRLQLSSSCFPARSSRRTCWRTRLTRRGSLRSEWFLRFGPLSPACSRKWISRCGWHGTLDGGWDGPTCSDPFSRGLSQCVASRNTCSTPFSERGVFGCLVGIGRTCRRHFHSHRRRRRSARYRLAARWPTWHGGGFEENETSPARVGTLARSATTFPTWRRKPRESQA